MFIASLFIIAKKCTYHKCLSTKEEWLNKMWYSHLVKYYIPIKRDEVLMHTTTWIKLEYIMLSEKDQI
jgi:ribosomal protein L11 methylase PrmA